MKKYFSLLLIMAIICASVCVSQATTNSYVDSKSKLDNSQAVTALQNSLNKENYKIVNEMIEDGLVEIDNINQNLMIAEINSTNTTSSTADGIHVATRKSASNSYKEIQTMFVLGSNIGAATGSAVYFMHYLGDGNLNVDSGIYYSEGSFRIFNYGTINASNGWDNSGTISVSAGDTVYVNSKLSGNQIITTVKKNGTTVGTLTDTLTKTYSGVGVCREFNIASHAAINNTNTYFSWSEAQSSMTTTGNVLKQMSSSNSSLQSVYYDNENADHSNIGYNITSTSSGGYIYDEAWCRCNYY